MSSVILGKIFSISAQRPKCEWVHGDSGEHVTCPDKHFINGICGSGKEANCEFGVAGIYCSKEKLKINFLSR